jgi:hypothetical protein
LSVRSDDHLFIAGPDEYRVRRVESKPIITTVAGDANYGFRGDDGPALKLDLLHQIVVLTELCLTPGSEGIE